jgi:tRNA (mo5U34)-methyltransferase
MFKLKRSPKISAALKAELDSDAAWMYPWQLTEDVVAPCPGTELPDVHRTRLEMMEPHVRRWLAANPQARALDLGCCEGWFAHRLLEWGADSVVGVDVRDVNIRRAELLRDHYGISPERLRFVHAGVHDTPADLGEFDIVLVLGLIYHLEDPIGALRVARRHARGHVLVESQLTELNGPIRHGLGVAGEFHETHTHWVAVHEPDEWQTDEGNVTASYGGIYSMIPNKAGLLGAMQVVGFGDLHILEASEGHNAQYTGGHRLMVAGCAI